MSSLAQKALQGRSGGGVGAGNDDFTSSKEDKEAMLNRKMEEIRRKNEALKKRHEMIQADRLAAEKSGQAINLKQAATSDPTPPPRPNMRGAQNEEGPAGQEGRRSKFSGARGKRSTNRSRDEHPAQNYEVKGRMAENASQTQGGKQQTAPGTEPTSPSGGDGPPPDPGYSFLADRSREGPLSESSRGRRGDGPRGGGGGPPGEGRGTGRRHPRNYGGGDFNNVKQRIQHEKYSQGRRRGGGGGAGRSEVDLQLDMTGRERREYSEWKRERERIDQHRMDRQKTSEGDWRREWDREKDEQTFDSAPAPPMSRQLEPARRPGPGYEPEDNNLDMSERGPRGLRGDRGGPRGDRGGPRGDRGGPRGGRGRGRGDTRPERGRGRGDFRGDSVRGQLDLRDKLNRNRGESAEMGEGRNGSLTEMGRGRSWSSAERGGGRVGRGRRNEDKQRTMSSGSDDRSVEEQNDSLVIKVDNQLAKRGGGRGGRRRGGPDRSGPRSTREQEHFGDEQTGGPVMDDRDEPSKPGDTQTTRPAEGADASQHGARGGGKNARSRKPVGSGRIGSGRLASGHEEEVMIEDEEGNQVLRHMNSSSGSAGEWETDTSSQSLPPDGADDDYWEDDEEFYKFTGRPEAPPEVEDDVHNSSIESFDDSSFNRFIEKNTLRIDAKTGLPARDARGRHLKVNADAVTPTSPDPSDASSPIISLKTPTDHTKVLDWGAEMDALSPSGSKSSSSQSPNDSPQHKAGSSAGGSQGNSLTDATKRQLFPAEGADKKSPENQAEGSDGNSTKSQDAGKTGTNQSEVGNDPGQNQGYSAESQGYEDCSGDGGITPGDVTPVVGRDDVDDDEEEFEDAAGGDDVTGGDDDEFVDAGSNVATPIVGSREVSAEPSPQASPAHKPAAVVQETTSPGQEPASTASTEQQPATTEQQPASTEQQPASTEQQPASTEQQPASTEQQPASTEQQPASTEQQPASTEQQPASTEQQPASTEQKPASQEKQPAPKVEETASAAQETTVQPDNVTEEVTQQSDVKSDVSANITDKSDVKSETKATETENKDLGIGNEELSSKIEEQKVSNVSDDGASVNKDNPPPEGASDVTQKTAGGSTVSQSESQEVSATSEPSQDKTDKPEPDSEKQEPEAVKSEEKSAES